MLSRLQDEPHRLSRMAARAEKLTVGDAVSMLTKGSGAGREQKDKDALARDGPLATIFCKWSLDWTQQHQRWQ